MKVEKEIFKLILNSAFGKMCESLLNRSRCDRPKGMCSIHYRSKFRILHDRRLQKGHLT